MLHYCLFDSSRITQKLPDWFQWNLMEGCGSRSVGGNCDIGHFSKFVLTSQRILCQFDEKSDRFRGLVSTNVCNFLRMTQWFIVTRVNLHMKDMASSTVCLRRSHPEWLWMSGGSVVGGGDLLELGVAPDSMSLAFNRPSLSTRRTVS